VPGRQDLPGRVVAGVRRKAHHPGTRAGQNQRANEKPHDGIPFGKKKFTFLNTVHDRETDITNASAVRQRGEFIRQFAALFDGSSNRISSNGRRCRSALDQRLR
ncbi:hypothetical protein ACQKHW_06575, partial [Staphylococcus hominis]|uniref:hypothetical protein n=1 Tax=Staphylococcus hominis TaxID=1290 RepID=UPI003D0617E2